MTHDEWIIYRIRARISSLEREIEDHKFLLDRLESAGAEEPICIFCSKRITDGSRDEIPGEGYYHKETCGEASDPKP